MLAGISHDLRTPLARLRVAIELLEMQEPALLEEMRLSVDEMDQMLGQFLNYVRASYRETPRIAVVDEVVREALRAESCHLQFALGAPEARCFAAEALRHALVNLTRNALEYGQEPVQISSSCLPGLVQIIVQDSGTGLSPAQWRQALRPFERTGEAPHAGHLGAWTCVGTARGHGEWRVAERSAGARRLCRAGLPARHDAPGIEISPPDFGLASKRAPQSQRRARPGLQHRFNFLLVPKPRKPPAWAVLAPPRILRLKSIWWPLLHFAALSEVISRPESILSSRFEHRRIFNRGFVCHIKHAAS